MEPLAEPFAEPFAERLAERLAEPVGVVAEGGFRRAGSAQVLYGVPSVRNPFRFCRGSV